MTTGRSITLFDLSNKQDTCWSPNTFLPRPVLAYKGIPYKTEWISYPDVQGRLRQHGQEHADTVTVPVLMDGEKYVADSWEIVKYLESLVPSPSILHGGMEVQEKFRDYMASDVKGVVFFWILAQIPPLLDDRGAEYFQRTRKAQLSCAALTERTTSDEETLPTLSKALNPVFHALRTSGAFIIGKEFSLADCLVLSMCQWIKQADAQKFAKFLALDETLQPWYERCAPYLSQMN